eukprot:snap_masked-scaffold_50-processed-gene-1.57-mRNA-1 protein AED:1.00 eAED:1.00 QI:0/-1/0/0/-1/1/1/0/194
MKFTTCFPVRLNQEEVKNVSVQSVNPRFSKTVVQTSEGESIPSIMEKQKKNSLTHAFNFVRTTLERGTSLSSSGKFKHWFHKSEVEDVPMKFKSFDLNVDEYENNKSNKLFFWKGKNDYACKKSFFEPENFVVGDEMYAECMKRARANTNESFKQSPWELLVSRQEYQERKSSCGSEFSSDSTLSLGTTTITSI